MRGLKYQDVTLQLRGAMAASAERVPRKAIAKACGLSMAGVTRQYSDGDGRKCAEVLLNWLRTTGDLAPLRVIAHELDHIVLPIRTERDVPLKSLSDSIREHSEACQAVLTSMEDNRMTYAEADRCLAEIEDAISALNNLAAAVKAARR